MLKIKRFYKPFILTLFFVICLLTVQAVCDLSLPNLMSDIVNNGIQSKGVVDASPEAVSERGFNFITLFMNEGDKDFAEKNYTFVSAGNADYTGKYPLAETDNIYVRNSLNSDDLARMNTIFGRAADTALNVMMSQNSAGGNASAQGGSMDLSNMTMDSDTINKIYSVGQMLPMMPANVLEGSMQKAKNTDSVMTASIGKVFTIGFYTELGIDVGKIQSSYIISVGLKMLGITFISAMAAAAVGFFASRMAAGVAKDLRKHIFEKVESFTNAEMDKFSTASLITRSTNDVTQIQQFTVIGTRMVLYSPILGIGALIMMLQKGSRNGMDPGMRNRCNDNTYNICIQICCS